MSGLRHAGPVTVRVLLADANALARRGLRVTLEADVDLEVVAEVEDAQTAIDLSAQLRPDVAVIDAHLPGGGLAACGAISSSDSVRVAVLAAGMDLRDLTAAARAGAAGYLLRDWAVDEAVATVRALADGTGFISSAMVAPVLTALADRGGGGLTPPGPGASRLTPREREVLTLVAEGLGNRDIAQRLFISENTVKNHLRGILEKLGLRSRTEAASYALRNGVVSLG